MWVASRVCHVTRCVTLECRWRDFWIYTRTNHPLLSVFLVPTPITSFFTSPCLKTLQVDPLHPFSKAERFFHGVATVLYRQTPAPTPPPSQPPLPSQPPPLPPSSSACYSATSPSPSQSNGNAPAGVQTVTYNQLLIHLPPAPHLSVRVTCCTSGIADEDSLKDIKCTPSHNHAHLPNQFSLPMNQCSFSRCQNTFSLFN